MSQIEEVGVIERMVTSSMISQGDPFGLSRAYYGKNLGCHNMLSWHMVTSWALWVKVLNMMYIFIHLCDKWQYLLYATYNMMCIGFVFGLEIIHGARGCSTPPFISFP